MVSRMIVYSSMALMALLSGPRETDSMGTATQSDREQIMSHIRSIFQAYLDRDEEAIRRLHTNDWVGFQGPSTSIERGIEAYMRNARKSLESFHGTGYELLDTEVQVYGDLALVYYVATYDYRDPDGESGTIPLRSLDIYRRDKDGWNQAGSHITVIPSAGSWGEGKHDDAGQAAGSGAESTAPEKGQ